MQLAKMPLLMKDRIMDQLHYNEMQQNLEALLATEAVSEKDIYIFGHCNASEELADLLMCKGYRVCAILDNNPGKQGSYYKRIPIIGPREILDRDMKRMLICVVSRAYEAMAQQMCQMGYSGRLEKLVDYNTFAEYSLAPETISRKRERLKRGMEILEGIRRKYNCYFYLLCPFSALGDVYYAMAYLPGFLKKNCIKDYTIITVGKGCSDIAAMFGCADREILSQNDMDELVQAVLFTRAKDAFIAHHDRPYANLLMRALKVKLIPFEVLYRCGVYGLEKNFAPCHPTIFQRFSGYDSMEKGNAVVLSPYAKSVAGVRHQVWREIISYFQRKGAQVYTNVSGEEEPLPGTFPLRVSLMELQSAVEWAGTFIGLRSGLCDVIKEAHCRKIVLFPDCCYSDTRWKVADFFYLEGWENIVVYETMADDASDDRHRNSMEERNAEGRVGVIYVK